ncbi:Hypothetical predicted protein [Octopus vulgaris]|uniref:Uncharacterized protein n=1 Tax=Octopus vulgaris TaxID=6645 RepID=A0AA36EZ82_OCTVU|nr:Hypothetical predicted protein [Octopus vulgaris]
MRWCSRIDRMSDERMPKQLFYGELAEGKFCRRKPKGKVAQITFNDGPDQHSLWFIPNASYESHTIYCTKRTFVMLSGESQDGAHEKLQ